MINLIANNAFINNKKNINLPKKYNVTFGYRDTREIDKFEKNDYNKGIELKGIIPQMDGYINIEKSTERDQVLDKYTKRIEQMPISLSFLMHNLKRFLTGTVQRKDIINESLMDTLQQRIFVGENGEDFKMNYKPEIDLLQTIHSQFQEAKKGNISTKDLDISVFNAVKEYVETNDNRQTTYII